MATRKPKETKHPEPYKTAIKWTRKHIWLGVLPVFPIYFYYMLRLQFTELPVIFEYFIALSAAVITAAYIEFSLKENNVEFKYKMGYGTVVWLILLAHSLIILLLRINPVDMAGLGDITYGILTYERVHQGILPIATPLSLGVSIFYSISIRAESL